MTKFNNPHHRGMSRHHRRPVSHKGTSCAMNTVWLPVAKHQAWHTLFGNMGPSEIADEITRLYLDPEWRVVAIKLLEQEKLE